MPEFRKLFGLPAVRLSRADIESLGRLVTEGLGPKPGDFDFALLAGDEIFRANSLDELLSQDLPLSVDELTIDVRGWTDDHKIDRGISIRLSPTVSMCQIHALEFKGKIQQLTEFFRRHGPWYSRIRNGLPGLTGALHAFSFTALLLFLCLGDWVFSGRLFPLVDIRLAKEPRLVERETLVVIIAAIAALANVAGIVIQALQK